MTKFKLTPNLTISLNSEKEDMNKDEGDREVPAKKAKFEEESDHESEGDFSEKLLEEFFKGKQLTRPLLMISVDVDSDDEQNVQEEFEIGDFAEGDFAEKLLEEFLKGKTADAASSVDGVDVDSDDEQDAQEEDKRRWRCFTCGCFSSAKLKSTRKRRKKMKN